MTQKAWYKSKVVWANIIALIIAILGVFTNVIPVQYLTYFAITMAVLNLVFRYLTDQPIGLRDIKAVTDTLKEIKTEPVK